MSYRRMPLPDVPGRSPLAHSVPCSIRRNHHTTLVRSGQGYFLPQRRLVERGVRFIELYCGSGSGWDAHTDLEGNHSKWCRSSDKPIAGLLADLKARGLLKDTLVVWGGEFGRTPFNEASTG